MSVTPEIKYYIDINPEDAPVRGNASASGDAAQDKEIEDAILAQLEQNPWAWCSISVHVDVRVDIGEEEFVYHGCDYLGCCSYKSPAEFEADGYYEDMKKNALIEAKLSMERAVLRGQTAAEMLKALQHP